MPMKLCLKPIDAKNLTSQDMLLFMGFVTLFIWQGCMFFIDFITFFFLQLWLKPCLKLPGRKCLQSLVLLEVQCILTCFLISQST